MNFGVHLRWLIRRDMEDVLGIEQRSFEFPWSENDFINCLRQKNCIGMVAEKADVTLGYMVYELHKSRLHVLNFAVDFDYQRMGVGTQMVKKLYGKLGISRRDHILLEVRESNLAAQLFFHKLGFKAVAVLADYYEDTTEDAYLMRAEWHPEWSAKPWPQDQGAN